MAWLRKSSGIEPLSVSMPGIKLGDRLLVVGASDTALIAALAIKAGLTGRACVVDASAGVVQQAAREVERAGALVETATAEGWRFPYDDGSFDVAVVRDVLGDAPDRGAVLAEAHRVLRAGGRCVIIDTLSKGGLAGLFGGGSVINPAYAASGGAAAAMTTANFAAVRTLAERDRLAFAEGVKRNI